MGTVSSPGLGGDPDADEPGKIAEPTAGERLRRRLNRRRERRGAEAAWDAYDAAVEKGLAGEELVGGELERRLAESGCVIVHSLRFLGFGDIDHLVIGPGGITVIDAKNWSGTVTVRGLLPRVGGWAKPDEIHKLQRQLAGVRLALLHARPELRNTGVRGVMCLAAEPERPATELKDGLVLGGSGVAAELAARPGGLTSGAIAHLRDVLTTYIPRVTGPEIDELQAPLAPQLTDTPPAGYGDGATHDGGGSPQRGRSGDARRHRILSISLLIPLISAGIVGWGIARLGLGVPQAPGRVTHLTLARRHHRLAVRYTAPAGVIVRLSIRGAGRTRQVDLHANGTQQTWTGPRIARRARPIHVRACVVQSSGRCGPSLTRALITHH